MRTTQLEIVRGLTSQRFSDAYRACRPFVVRDAISHWPACQHWTPQYFQRRYGDLTVITERYDPREKSSYLDQTLADIHQTLPLRQFLETLGSGDRRFALREDTSLFARIPELLDDLVRFSPFPVHGDSGYKALWVGPPEYVTGLHTDPGPTLLFQIHGRKQVLLFAPDQTPFLYEVDPAERGRKFDTSILQSRLDAAELSTLRDVVGWAKVEPFDPDLARFPLFARATGIEGYLEPGDTLYIPDRWWHAVRSLEPAISVSVEPDFSCLDEAERTLVETDPLRQRSR